VVYSGISLYEALSRYYNKLLAYQNLHVKGILPSSYSTTSNWIAQAYKDARPKVSQALAKATLGLTLSFDRWTANNNVLDLLGIVVYYLNSNYQRCAVVLGLRDTLGSHTGANIADHLLSVINDFQIGHQIAFFIADNASNNDKALAVLSSYLPSLKIDPVKQQLRCSSHIYNLMCKAILYSVNGDCLEDAS
jgi:hypothetical protein